MSRASHRRIELWQTRTAQVGEAIAQKSDEAQDRPGSWKEALHRR
jgi:hypothetical protein